MSDEITIYTDGGADPNPGIGGWAALLHFGEHERVLTGSEPQTTNNRMELTAAVEALKVLKRPCSIQFYTDSQYLRRGITEWIEGWAQKGWKSSSGKPVQNVDLWQTLWPLVQQHDITWHWVKGHAGDPQNERVDRLARQARLNITPDLVVDLDAPRVYIKGVCRGNPGPGAWGVVIERGGETEQWSGTVANTTNNRMELTAALEAINRFPSGSTIQLFTTSDYLYQGITKWIHGWRKRNWLKKDQKPVANADLWQELERLMALYTVHWGNAKGEKMRGIDEAASIAANALKIF